MGIMKRKTIILTVIILAALGLVAFGLFGSGRGAGFANDFETETIERGTLSSIVEANGIVQSNQTALLFWKISGKVDEMLVKPGDQVRVDDILASLATTSLPSYIITSRAELLSAQDALDDLKNSEIQQAQAQKAVDKAQKALDDTRFPQALQAQALLAIAEAGKAVEGAQRNYMIIASSAPQSAISQAYANLLLAENKVKDTEEMLDRLENTVINTGPPGIIIPEEVINSAKHQLRRAIKQIELLLTQERLAYEKSLARYSALLEPPDPLQVAAAQAELATAKAQLEAAELEWERIKDGFSPAEIALLEARVEAAQRDWTRVKDGPDPDDITLLETQIAAAEAAIRQMKITAPFDGTVTSVKTQVNDLVNAGTLAFRLDDLSSLHVDLAVSEIDINSIELGQKATITFDSILAKEYQGEVTDIALVGTEVFGATNYMVRVEVLNADAVIKPGMTASVKIVVNEIENVLLVPSQAIRMLNGDNVVYRWVSASQGGSILSLDQSEDSGSGGGFRLPLVGQNPDLNQIQPVAITLGATSNTYSEVESGDLRVGDVIVLNPSGE
jgi:HlyD family secretion protein